MLDDFNWKYLDYPILSYKHIFHIGTLPDRDQSKVLHCSGRKKSYHTHNNLQKPPKSILNERLLLTILIVKWIFVFYQYIFKTNSLPLVDFLLGSIHIFHRYNLLCCYKEWLLYCQVCNLLQDRHGSLDFLHHIHTGGQNNLERIRKYHTCKFHDQSIVVHFQCNP